MQPANACSRHTSDNHSDMQMRCRLAMLALVALLLRAVAGTQDFGTSNTTVAKYKFANAMSTTSIISTDKAAKAQARYRKHVYGSRFLVAHLVSGTCACTKVASVSSRLALLKHRSGILTAAAIGVCQQPDHAYVHAALY